MRIISIIILLINDGTLIIVNIIVAVDYCYLVVAAVDYLLVAVAAPVAGHHHH